ncbi:hypothetical protein [Polynucleobacter necessarius]|uniref:hypothetical protein n=1 Tax=Polynucleobacter necessarius TaxID=576610 RepID=UPI000E092B8F|nr:hypothetical protein [Polynucleobacter necessarius]
MDPAVVNKIDQAVKAAMADPQIKETLDAQEVCSLRVPQRLQRLIYFWLGELVKYQRLVKSLNIKAE